jgi:ADP-glucose pyrophosphorylase
VVENSILWEGVTIGSRATVQNSIIGNGVSIDSGEQVSDSSLLSTG